MAQVSVQVLIEAMVGRIVQQFAPEQIVLFGSCARDAAGPDSDADLLVVMPVEGSIRQQAAAIYSALMDVGMPKDIVVATPEDVARYRNVVGSIIHEALSQGKVLYERAA